MFSARKVWFGLTGMESNDCRGPRLRGLLRTKLLGRRADAALAATGIAGELAGQIIENTKEVFTGIKEALLKGPLTVEQNYAAWRHVA